VVGVTAFVASGKRQQATLHHPAHQKILHGIPPKTKN